MQKKSVFWLLFTLSIVLTLITACGSNSSTSPSGSTKPVPTVPPGENLYVLDGYTPLGATSTTQHILAFHPEGANPSAFATLPAGLVSLDHQRIYAATAENGKTTISVINTQTGTTIRSLVITGTYSTAGRNYTNSVLSSDGHWLALRALGQPDTQTTIALIDTQTGKLAKTIQLSGNFELDAISPDGNSLYLIEKLNDHSGNYNVRLYLVDQNQLYEYPIIDKTVANDNMSGGALTRQMSSDGRMAYTLYINTARNIAFIHMLPLDGSSFPFARCIDLPVGHSADRLHYYTLALSSDGTTLYAANGALGVVSEINVSGNGTDIFNDKLVATVHFNSGDVSMTSADKTRMLYNAAALSPDQKTLYFAGMYGIRVVNTDDLHAQRSSLVRGNYLSQQAITGLALSGDGRTLYAVDPAHGITLLNAATGQSLRVLQGPAQTPWGIEWIAG
jgi:DNA-binding beta-propeller fold protein YncE